MPITTLLAAAPGAASSADQVVADGATVRVSVTGSGTVLVEPKLATGYGQGEYMGGTGARHGYVSGPMTFRVSRPADSSAGVDVEAA